MPPNRRAMLRNSDHYKSREQSFTWQQWHPVSGETERGAYNANGQECEGN